MKKVLVCCTYWKPNVSGLTRYAENLVKLLGNKFEFTVLTSDYKNIGSEENVFRSKVWFQIGKGVFMPWWWVDSYQMVKRADVVNCHMPNLESWLICFWAKIMKKKIVLTHHCEFAWSGNWQNKLIFVSSFIFHWLSYFWADKIVAYTQDYAENGSYFLKLFADKIVYILPPVVLESGDEIYAKKMISNWPQHLRKIGFAGRLTWEKGLKILFEAVSKMKNGQLILAGPYENMMGDYTYASIKLLEKKLANKPIFLGSLNGHELVSFYEKIDCLVLPSIDNLETFGLVQAEAMLCGTPVVASNLPGVRIPVLQTGMGEIAKVKDSKDLMDKIEMVLKNRKKYTQNIDKARKMFDLEKFKKSYMSVFEGR
jgi:glycosyltransferase involved in cell wall biosynthesis